jgi:hypothetical protein
VDCGLTGGVDGVFVINIVDELAQPFPFRSRNSQQSIGSVKVKGTG